MNQGEWGVEVKSLDSGRALYERNSHKLMMPASNMKIVTLATAAQTLGWDFRFTTTLETAAPIQDGVLAGDLIVRGTGDPTINTRNQRATAVFDDWALALRGLGINRIDGDIVGDDNAFDDEGLGAGWAWDYLQYGYAAPVGALQYNEDVAALTIAAGPTEGAPASVTLAPGSGLRVINRAYTGAAKSAVTVDYVRRLDAPVLEVTGSVPIDGAPLTRTVAVVNPTIFFAQSLKDALEARGIHVTGGAEDADERVTIAPPDTRRLLVQTQSPPLREVATTMMKVSENLYAETLLKASGAADGGLGTVAGGWLAQFPQQAVAESRAERIGSETMLTRMAELMFVEVVRRHMERIPEQDIGWLAGLRDPVVGPALTELHEHPAHSWTLPELARRVASSRTVLAERFSHVVGVPPMLYLTRWRLQLAAEQLLNSSAKVAAVGAQVGYDSEAAFSRAFKRETGLSPAAWRHSRQR